MMRVRGHSENHLGERSASNPRAVSPRHPPRVGLLHSRVYTSILQGVSAGQYAIDGRLKAHRNALENKRRRHAGTGERTGCRRRVGAALCGRSAPRSAARLARGNRLSQIARRDSRGTSKARRQDHGNRGRTVAGREPHAGARRDPAARGRRHAAARAAQRSGGGAPRPAGGNGALRDAGNPRRHRCASVRETRFRHGAAGPY